MKVSSAIVVRSGVSGFGFERKNSRTEVMIFPAFVCSG